MSLTDKIEIKLNLSQVYGFSYYDSGISLIQRLYIRNKLSSELNDVEIVVQDKQGYITPFKKIIAKIPPRITIDVEVQDLKFSTEKLLNLDTSEVINLIITAREACEDLKENKVEQQVETLLLPITKFCGTGFLPELISGFVHIPQDSLNCLMESAESVLKGWKVPLASCGYSAEKNETRYFAAAIFRAIQLLSIKRIQSGDYQNTTDIISVQEVVTKFVSSEIEIALLYSAIMEQVGLNPVIIFGKKRVLCGLWLVDNCFLESSFDDVAEIKKRSADGINELAIFDTSEMFEGGKVNFAGAEKAAQELLNQSEFESCITVDIKRCRIAGFSQLPIKINNGKEIKYLNSKPQNAQQKPIEIKKDIKNLKIRPDLTRERQWERRLLDLSLKNKLLSFSANKNSLHIMSSGAESFMSAMLTGQDFEILEMPKEGFSKIKLISPFNSRQDLLPLADLITLEIKNKRISSFSDPKELSTTLTQLYKKDKISLEETGAGVLYVAAGFLKWAHSGSSEFRYAPLVLLPINLVKKSAGKGYTISMREDDYSFNTTLLEFLKQEFNVELRGLDDLKKEDRDLNSVFTTIRRQIMSLKGWEIYDDIYISTFTFSRYLMWHDLRHNMDTFRKNPIVNALITGTADSKVFKKMPTYSPDDSKAKALFMPITADHSQYSAVMAASQGSSFVLHGPPGTGKSQTITNIIADSLARGKRVLFVAEKAAALAVVKKRIESVGLGDFCLELSGEGVQKNNIAQKLLSATEKRTEKQSDFAQTTKSIKEVKDLVQKTFDAVHKKRQLGISVYDAIIRHKEYENAPDVLDIDSIFIESLNLQKLKNCESMLNELLLITKESGQIYNSPFAGVECRDYITGLSASVQIYSKALREDARHLRAYADLCFEVFGNRQRILSNTRLELLYKLCKKLQGMDTPVKNIFRNGLQADAVVVLNNFTVLYKAFQQKEKEYNLAFKSQIDLPAEPALVIEELDRYGSAFRKSKMLKVLIRKIDRSVQSAIKTDEDYIKLIKLSAEFDTAKTDLARSGDSTALLFASSKKEKINYGKVAEIVLQLNSMYSTAEKLFNQFDHAAFNKMLLGLFGEYPSPVLTSYISAYETFFATDTQFRKILSMTKDYETGGDYLVAASEKATLISDNIDLLAGWVRFNNISDRLTQAGLSFATVALKENRITPKAVIDCFYKKVYKGFIDREIATDEALSNFSSASAEESIERLRELSSSYEKNTEAEIYNRIASRLPNINTEGDMSLELVALQRAVKSGMRGITLRALLGNIKTILPSVCPCFLMSPVAVSQYLEPNCEMFDILIFDEASQMPTCEAIGSLARSCQAVIVGDPKQLPPTSFFSADYTDEDNLQNEDLESILDDSLALGLPEKYLQWHYRSKHESLIAFSNSLYYENRLSTFPSPDSARSKVSFNYVANGVYDRGATKQNVIEAEKLVEEVVKRLKSGVKSSIGIITFSIAQQSLLESKLSQALAKNKLESIAYEREEPIFVKNLENVQGDERDIIFISVGYGPDKAGRLAYNFGPLNRDNGWRRLNVATSRGREEMLVFASMTSAMLDLSKSSSKGVAGLKALIEFADTGRHALALKSSYVSETKEGLGKYLSRQLKSVGVESVCDLGVSGFKIDVAVIDPKDSSKYLLAVMFDNYSAYETNSLKDTVVLQTNMLKRLGWNVCRIFTLNYFANPKREVRRIKQLVSRLIGETASTKSANKFIREYKTAEIPVINVTQNYVLDSVNNDEISKRLTAIIKAEQPISEDMIIKRCLASYSVLRVTSIVNSKLQAILQSLPIKHEELNGTKYYRFDDSVLKCDFFRADMGAKVRRQVNEISPYEIVGAIRYLLNDKLNMQKSEVITEVSKLFYYFRANPEMENAINWAINYGSQNHLIIVSINDTITM